MTLHCNRCRRVQALAGDTYCLSCSAWESLGRELQASWPIEGIRSIVTDLIVSVTRQARALRNYSGAVALKADLRSGEQEAAGNLGADQDRPALERRRSEPPKKQARVSSSVATTPKRRSEPKAEAESEEGSEGDEEEEAESEGADPGHRPLGGGSRRPPEPDGPPPGRHRDHPWREKDKNRESKRHQERHHERRHHEKKSEKKRPHHRGGRKHQRLGRLEKNPLLRVHRRLPKEFFEVRADDLGREALERF